jgi:beta-N-acetylhexosaminidase
MGLEGPDLSPDESSLISQQQPAGFVLFSRNIVSAQQTRRLTDDLRKLCAVDPIIAIDQEGGRVVRTSALGLELPSAGALTRVQDNGASIAQSARLIAQSLRLLGINLDLAPVLDISYNDDIANALPSRCWGNSPDQVIQQAGMFIANLSHFGLASCGKHFPGMGRAQSDPHLNLPVIATPANEHAQSDLAPFTALAQDLPAIMTAHILIPELDPNLPATLSPHIIKTILRGQLGYKGLVLTDDLCMGAIRQQFDIAHATHLAWLADCDLPLICHDPIPAINELASQPDPRSDYDKADSERRLAHFIKHLKPLPEFSQSLWDQILKESHALNNQGIPESPTTPHSQVQDY